jgi:hypothetical protein
VDISKAPTKTHGELAGLIPNADKALIKDSVKYGNWLAETGDIELGNAENATLPAVTAEYRSTGYTITTNPELTEGTAEQDYIQKATLFIIQAPEEAAAQPLADQFIAKLEAKGFSARPEVEFADGLKKVHTIYRFARVDAGEKVDSVYVAYIKVIGKRVLIAIESEAADKLAVPGASQLGRVDGAGIGTRVGGQLIVLILAQLSS